MPAALPRFKFDMILLTSSVSKVDLSGSGKPL